MKKENLQEATQRALIEGYKNLKENKSKKVEETKRNFINNVDELPDMCYGLLPSDNSIIIIKKGENGYYETDLGSPENAEEVVNDLNERMGVTPDQRFTMEIRSISNNWEDTKFESKKVEAKEPLTNYRIISLSDGRKIMLNKKHSTQDFQKAMKDAYKKVKDTIKDNDMKNEVDIVLANVDPSFDWLELEDVNESKKVEAKEDTTSAPDYLEKAFEVEVEYWLQALVDEDSNDEIGKKAQEVLDDKNKMKEIVNELVDGSDDLWEDIHRRIEELAGLHYRESSRVNESKKVTEARLNFLSVSELPDMCYGILPSDESIIIIKKGERGYYRTDLGSPENAEEVVDGLNEKMGVTKDQRFTMEIRSINNNWVD